MTSTKNWRIRAPNFIGIHHKYHHDYDFNMLAFATWQPCGFKNLLCFQSQRSQHTSPAQVTTRHRCSVSISPLHPWRGRSAADSIWNQSHSAPERWFLHRSHRSRVAWCLDRSILNRPHQEARKTSPAWGRKRRGREKWWTGECLYLYEGEKLRNK